MARAKQITIADMQERVADAETATEAAVYLAETFRAERDQARDRIRELEHECAELSVELAEANALTEQALDVALEHEIEIDARDEEEAANAARD